MRNIHFAFLAVSLVAGTYVEPAHAHFKLLKPTSWLHEDQAAYGGGAPQKGSPCGPGAFDDVEPVPVTGVVTDFHAGETIEVDWIDTIAHPGHFRIALAANRADLKDPTIVQDSSCNYDETMVPKGASGNVLADGILFRSRVGFNATQGTMFSYMVTLPNTPCDKCTLQVLQVMESDIQGLSNCHYFHCADIRILPADGSAGGSAGAGGSSAMGSGGTLSTGGGVALGMGGTLGLGGMLATAAGTTGVTPGGLTGSAGVVGMMMGTAGSAPTTPNSPGASGTAPGAATSGNAPSAAGGSSVAPSSGTAGSVATAGAPSSAQSNCSISRVTDAGSGQAPRAASLLGLLALVRRRRARSS